MLCRICKGQGGSSTEQQRELGRAPAKWGAGLSLPRCGYTVTPRLEATTPPAETPAAGNSRSSASRTDAASLEMRWQDSALPPAEHDTHFQ